jgi:hypothetical protein
MDPDVRELVEMTSLCKELHVLPRAGGLLDQDSYHVYGMGLVLAAFNERQQLEHRRMEAEQRTKARRR